MPNQKYEDLSQTLRRDGNDLARTALGGVCHTIPAAKLSGITNRVFKGLEFFFFSLDSMSKRGDRKRADFHRCRRAGRERKPGRN
jgi:hypothetical protein